MTTALPWLVDVAVPDGLGDLGLHRDENTAAAAFRTQLIEVLGPERAAEVGPAAEREFRRARAGYAGKPVLWSGFILLASRAASGIAGELDPAVLPSDPAEAERVRALATVEDALLLTLSVGVTPTDIPTTGPLSPAALVGRALEARYGDDITAHAVSYGDRQAVASVRTAEPAEVRADGEAGRGKEATTPPHMVLVEVRVLFPEEGAMVTVAAATAQAGAIDRAALLVGSVARTVRLRTEETRRETPDQDAASGPPSSPARLRVLLPDGARLPDGLTLLGRAPGPVDGLAADHHVTLADESVSRTHLALRIVSGAVTATDLRSTNGTVVRRGGELLRLVPGEAMELRSGDDLNLGSVILRVAAGG